MVKKEIINRLQKTCALCSREIKVILYRDKTYRGGHYFGEIPICSKKEMDKAIKSGSHKTTIANHTIDVLNYDPKPCAHKEYWECPKCYWRR